MRPPSVEDRKLSYRPTASARLLLRRQCLEVTPIDIHTIPRASRWRSNELTVGLASLVAAVSVATVATGFACSASWIMSSEPAMRVRRAAACTPVACIHGNIYLLA